MGVGWDGGTVGRWDGGTVGRWDGGTVGQWDSGTVGRWDGGTVGLGNTILIIIFGRVEPCLRPSTILGFPEVVVSGLYGLV